MVEKPQYAARYYWLRFWGLEWLFMLGHMRSGSSLLVHLLNSNPEVLGYGETPIRYTGRRSFVELHDHVLDQFEKNGQPSGSEYRYVMDKILWHKNIQSRRFLKQVPLSVIVIVRTPTEALPSILSLDLDEIQTPEEALSYYVGRLTRMREILSIYDSSFAFVTYSDLTEQTNKTLRRISEYLALKEQLTPTYETMWSTGESGIGDPSDRIKEGQIKRSNNSYNVNVDTKIINRARKKYRNFCEEFD